MLDCEYEAVLPAAQANLSFRIPVLAVLYLLSFLDRGYVILSFPVE